MLLRRTLRSAVHVLGALLLFGGGACVEPFGGSSLEVTFDPGVQTPTPEGTPGQCHSVIGDTNCDGLDATTCAGTENCEWSNSISGRPPPGTYYAFYSVNYTYQTDADGNLVLDADDQPIVESSYVFEAQRFEVRPLIRMASPCFIEKTHSPFLGLHVTQEANKLREQTGISDPLNPPAGTPETDVIDVLTSDVRMGVLPALQNSVKVITHYSAVEPVGVHPDFQVATECVEDNPSVDPTRIPPATCIGPDSNARRLELCQQYWDRYPEEYEGSDKVFTLPLNGHWRGAVTGLNPKNSGFLGGAHFYTEAALDDFDALLVNWQYKDMDGDGEPDYPAGTEDHEKSVIGYHYMEGTPVIKTRGVINVPLTNQLYNITSEAAIIPSLADDDVQF